MMGDPQAALAEAQVALQLARGEAPGAQASQHIATAQWLRGEALLRLNRLSEAGPAIREGLAAAKASPDTKLHGDLVMAEAGLLATQGKVQPALQGFQHAYRIFGRAREPRSQAIALHNIGSIYQDAGDYAKVLQYYAQAAEVFPGDPVLVLTAHNNIGRAYQSLGKLDEAVAEFERSLERARQMKSPLLEAHILTNLASAEIDLGRLASAARHLDDAEALTARDASARDWRPSVWAVKGQLELKRGRPQAAARLLERTFAGVDLDTTSLVERDFHKTAYDAYSALGDDARALAHLRAYKRLDDEAREVAASTNAALMAAQFDYANQASRIAQLKAGQLQRDIELAQTRNLIIGVLLAASVLTGVLLAIAFLSIRRSRNEVRVANGKLSSANRALEKALAAKTEFLAMTSHEIRTPLNGILGMTQMMLRDPGLDPSLRDKLTLVQDSGETMRALVDDVFDAAKLEGGNMEIVPADTDVRRLFEQACQLWSERAHEKGLTLTLDLVGAPQWIVADAGRLRQILLNLVSNAIKFTSQGGVRVMVRAEADATGELLAITVADTGIGIAPEWLEGVFEAFRQVDASRTRAYEGTGLGLAICRSLARAMGGDIAVASTPGEGSAFTVRLPLVRAATPSPAQTPTASQSFGDCRVLLVDSNPLSEALIRAVLAPQVGSVQAAPMAAEAAAAAAAGGFDVVLADAAALGLDMAARLEAARGLADAAAPGRVVLMIGDTPEADVAAFAAAGVAQVVRKPISAPQLAEQVRVGFEGRVVPERKTAAA
jgi:signal transduction histidine kinase